MGPLREQASVEAQFFGGVFPQRDKKKKKGSWTNVQQRGRVPCPALCLFSPQLDPRWNEMQEIPLV
jgi:hypothetical protein